VKYQNKVVRSTQIMQKYFFNIALKGACKALPEYEMLGRAYNLIEKICRLIGKAINIISILTENV